VFGIEEDELRRQGVDVPSYIESHLLEISRQRHFGRARQARNLLARILVRVPFSERYHYKFLDWMWWTFLLICAMAAVTIPAVIVRDGSAHVAVVVVGFFLIGCVGIGVLITVYWYLRYAVQLYVERRQSKSLDT